MYDGTERRGVNPDRRWHNEDKRFFKFERRKRVEDRRERPGMSGYSAIRMNKRSNYSGTKSWPGIL